MSNTARTHNNRAANNRAAENQVKEKPAEENRAEGNRMEERAVDTRPAVDSRPVDTRPRVSSIDEDEEYIPPRANYPLVRVIEQGRYETMAMLRNGEQLMLNIIFPSWRLSPCGSPA